MKTLFSYLTIFLCIVNVHAQTLNTFYESIVANTSETNILNDLTTFESFGVNRVGTPALTATENWITARYQNLGYSDIELQPFTYALGTSNNIIITKTGTLYPNTYVIIDAHYDTINGPGTNDNGTGTVLLLELARLLANVETEYSIKFIHFSGEEDGLIGSNYYVNNTVIPENLDIKLVFNIDEVGGVNGMVNDVIVCERDLGNPQSNNQASDEATTILANCMELYSNLTSEISYAYASDYIPFENNGEIITGLYEKNISPVNHTANDVLANMDTHYAYEVTKGALGAAMEFAIAYESLGIDESDFGAIEIYPNPADSILQIRFSQALLKPIAFEIIDTSGKLVLEKSLSLQTEEIPVTSLQGGTYFAILRIENKRMIRKIIID